MKKEAALYKKTTGSRAECLLCSHNCKINPGCFGICGVRQNLDGTLYTLVYAEPVALHVDPIEKKPLYHFLPGSLSFSIATIGCNFKCGFCQNWQISQASKKEAALNSGDEVMPEEIVKAAISNNCKSISYTYTEPTIYFEYAYDTAMLAKKKGLYNIFVTNGFMSKPAIDRIKSCLDAANIDLKSFNDDFYKKTCGARLAPVLDSIIGMKKAGIWVEITTLLIPGLNDSDKELAGIAGFIANIDSSMPWHISRFHPQYQMAGTVLTSLESLRKAYDIGKKAGLHYVYLGNVAEGNDTFCPQCGSVLVERKYFDVSKLNIKNGQCVHCRKKISGLWK